MKKKIFSFLKNNIIMIWLVSAIVCLSLLGASAAYASVKNAKRVVSTKGSVMLFSSNILTDETDRVRTVNSDVTFIYIYNYAKGNKNNYSKDKDIDYDLMVQLTDEYGNVVPVSDIPDGYSFKLNDTTGSFNTNIRSELSKLKPNYDTVEINMPPKNNGSEYNVKITATPVPDPDFRPLGVVLTRGTPNDSQSISWSGYFTDSFNNGVSTKDYDGFNYRVSGKGVGTITLQWDTRYVTIGPWADTSLIDSVKDTTNGTISFFVDSENNATQYDIPFYRVSEAPENEMYDESKNYVYVEEQGYKSIYVEFVSFEKASETTTEATTTPTTANQSEND